VQDHRIDGTSPLKANERFTYKDYRKWPEGERWELIHGTAWSMSPAPRRNHQALTGQLYARLDQFFAGKPCRPHIAPVDVFLPEGDEALDETDIVVQPDIFVVCDRSKLIEEGVRGAPDFVIEILSPSTALKDQSEKRMLYESHGVREYWIVNPITMETFIYILRDGKYGLPTVASLYSAVPVALFPKLDLKVRPEDL
jgi:Uma2 family endonuclease